MDSRDNLQRRFLQFLLFHEFNPELKCWVEMLAVDEFSLPTRSLFPERILTWWFTPLKWVRSPQLCPDIAPTYPTLNPVQSQLIPQNLIESPFSHHNWSSDPAPVLRTSEVLGSAVPPAEATAAVSGTPCWRRTPSLPRRRTRWCVSFRWRERCCENYKVGPWGPVTTAVVGWLKVVRMMLDVGCWMALKC